MILKLLKKLLRRTLRLDDPKSIGKRGENRIVRKLKGVRLIAGDGLILRNVYIPKGSGGTAEIDIVFITRIGIFVIESKNYKGYVFGNEEHFQWTITLLRGSYFGRRQAEKFHVYNPIMQNKNHVNHLKAYLNLDRNIPVYSLVVFSDSCALKNITRTSGSDAVVCQTYQVGPTLRYGLKKKPRILNEDEMMAIYDMLLPLTKVGEHEKKKHIENIKSSQRDGSSATK